MKIIRPLAFGLLCVLVSSTASAQGATSDTRPGSNTIFGDTGLWFVPTGETVPKGTWSGSIALVNFDRSEGFSDITDIGGMFAFGVTDRVELFGTMGYRRLDADLVPVARNGQPQNYLINQGWTTGLGDAVVGVKFNIRSQAQSNGPAFAARVSAKIPTASADDGLGTGKLDFMFDLIGSREFSEKVELTTSIGVKMRGRPDGYNLSHGFVWGIGMGYPSRSKLKLIAEMHGEALFDQDQRYTGPSLAAIGMPSQWDPDATRDLFGGFQFHSTRGLFFGAGVSYTASYYLHRRDFVTSEDSDFDRLGLQVRLGYHPGVRDLCAARAAGAGASHRESGAATEPSADREGALRAVHRAGGPHQHRDGRRAGSGRRHAALPLDQPDGHICQPRRSPDGVDRARPAGRRAGHRDGRRRQGRHGERHHHHPGRRAAAQGIHVRRRALRLRSLHAARRKPRASWTRPSRR